LFHSHYILLLSCSYFLPLRLVRVYPTMAATWGEMFPLKASFTEKDIPDQHGRVFIITGGSAGIGYELVRLFITSMVASTWPPLRSNRESCNRLNPSPQACIWAGRERREGRNHILTPRPGRLDYSQSLGHEVPFQGDSPRCHMAQRRSHYSPNDTPTKQGYHVQLGINALGPFLFQTYLTPFCLKTASLPSDPKAATRIIFVSSSGHRDSPTPDSIQWDDINPKSATGLCGHALKYGQSKAMNVMHAHELAR
jgi:retinol dehydrogenase 12